MQRKYSKHFIYKWLKEDLFGEFTLHKSKSNVLTQLILKRVWRYMTSNWKTYRRGLLTRRSILVKREQQLLSNLLYKLRFKSKIIPSLTKKIVSTRKQVLLTKYWKAAYNKNRSIVFLSEAAKNPKLRVPPIDYDCVKLKSFLKSKVYRRSTPYRYRFSITRKKWLFINSFFKNVFFPFRKKRKCKLRHFIVHYKRHYYPSLFISSKARTYLKNIKPALYLYSWNSFVRSVKWGLNKILGKTKARFFFPRSRNFVPRFDFTGTFKPRKRLVKRGEAKAVLNFRLLQYFNLVRTSADVPDLFKRYVYTAKQFSLPSLSRMEFQVPTVIIRAGFLENGYVAASLTKRSVFLVNGALTTSNTILNVWDIITVAKPLWWLIYARFIHFFLRITVTRFSKFKKKQFLNLFVFRKLKKSNYLRKRRFFSRSLKRKLNLRRGERLPIVTRTFLSSKNYVLSLPPSYMEVSFKLFLIVIWRLVLNPTQVTRPFNLYSIRSMLFNKKKASKVPFQIEVGVSKL